MCVGMQLLKVMEDCWNNEHREADLRFAKLLECMAAVCARESARSLVMGCAVATNTASLAVTCATSHAAKGQQQLWSAVNSSSREHSSHGRRKNRVGTRLLYLESAAAWVVCTTCLVTLSMTFSSCLLLASTIKMAVQAASLAHTASNCIKALDQLYCLDLLHYCTCLHLRCIIAEVRDCNHAYPTALNAVTAASDDYRLLHKNTLEG